MRHGSVSLYTDLLLSSSNENENGKKNPYTQQCRTSLQFIITSVYSHIISYLSPHQFNPIERAWSVFSMVVLYCVYWILMHTYFISSMFICLCCLPYCYYFIFYFFILWLFQLQPLLQNVFIDSVQNVFIHSVCSKIYRISKESITFARNSLFIFSEMNHYFHEAINSTINILL